MNMTVPTSSARSALEKCLKNRARIADQLDQATERTKEYYAADRKQVSAARRLEEFVSSEEAAVVAWTNGEADAPPSEVKGRATLEAELKSAIAKADEARVVAAPFLDAAGRFNVQMRRADLDVEIARVLVLIEEMGAEIAKLEADAKKFYQKVIEVDQGVDFINSVARNIGKLDTTTPDVDLVRPILSELERTRERVILAVDRHRAPAYPSDIASRLTSLITALGLDAAAQLESS